MIYLKSFTFPTDEQEFDYMLYMKDKCYNTIYPFKVLSQRRLQRIDFAPITILYGGNGSGKTTALNIIAQKLQLARTAVFNRSSFFEDYLEMCDYTIQGNTVPAKSKIITSDDVFDTMLNVRKVNEGIDVRREELFEEHQRMRGKDNGTFRLQNFDDLDELTKIIESRKTRSMYVKRNVGMNVREQSNGESAYRYFFEHIKEEALYLLDEPENSLSPEKQLQFVKFLEDSVRFYHCQFVIATHSPFVLSLKDAKIYDLDETPVAVKPWTELHNVRVYFDFFKNHEEEF